MDIHVMSIIGPFRHGQRIDIHWMSISQVQWIFVREHPILVSFRFLFVNTHIGSNVLTLPVRKTLEITDDKKSHNLSII